MMNLLLLIHNIMPRSVVTTTVSLPKSIAADIRRLCRKEGRTTSELMREAFRQYRRAHGASSVSWAALKKELARVSKSGKRSDLASFISTDRHAH